MATNKAKIGAYIPHDVYEKLKALADKEKRSVSSVVYLLIIDYVNRGTLPPYTDTTEQQDQ